MNEFIGNKARARLSLVWLPLAAATLSAAGCTSGPTYGTGVGSETQLMNDMSNILSIRPNSREKIDYKPRPELVRPGAPERGALPAPQQRVATAGNPEWPESPEERRARIRAEATANRDNLAFDPEVGASGANAASAPVVAANISPREAESGPLKPFGSADRSRRDEIKKRLAETKQGDPTTRRYLSDPPLTYRQAADTAPTGDVGEDEWRKEKRLKAEAKARSGKKGGWFDWLPGT